MNHFFKILFCTILLSHTIHTSKQNSSPKKKVDFAEFKYITLIPICEEYHECNLASSLWYDDDEYSQMKNFYINEIMKSDPNQINNKILKIQTHKAYIEKEIVGDKNWNAGARTPRPRIQRLSNKEA